ncbi:MULTISPECIES: bifunctional hydroxymethylpyrimidine kinase/phosphomethylpyrimidine kinase [Auritidibacter]|uniref:bifunctional hydroxymethylpyrimidine kinase/phosphomethylpyrimidine kinase n=1 Tax=Auritidibacter TaxID=1160973 RepID=UPI000D73F0F8|nr:MULTISPECIES: bifunctional hydroxymethylpyrimidine kinase/phosphomethylpyrimidine kinase [Auritidibacter]AXR73765.1 bifunctional hydroxymethylpyrimidine kinase/phosphomethylpyrimidine kinase [Auritidibacter sp. NML130574]NIH72337.1 hydroxymethylpyrimidine/phosphomethylpyrimidine kinase [Auritidibacter ignavus]PXA78804.1 bifunctional hydroxymethylpyrimidine kinase/phosphomethylpyrimidine kinase [Auritidibacter sp. NML120636]RMX21945.1 bifunctional hydroxymethylpyrimidine kinase/phosphomethylp
MTSRPATALTIAGTDPSGGAGIQADLKTFTALGVYGTSAITSLIAQNTQGVQQVIPIGIDDLRAQIRSVLDDLPIDATKIGMLGSAEMVKAVAKIIADRREEFGVLVVDPVLVATSGDSLSDDDAALAMVEHLLPLADVVTPNLPEAARLSDADAEAESLEQMTKQAHVLAQHGTGAVMVKGGHLYHDTQEMTDVVVINGEAYSLPIPRVSTRNTHGTGCTLSSAIAARAALNVSAQTPPSSEDLLAWIKKGQTDLARALAAGAQWELSYAPQTGHGPVNHLALRA